MNSIKIVNRMMALLGLSMLSACSVLEGTLATVSATPTPIPPARLIDASTISGSWVPSVTDSGTVNNKGATVTNRTILSRSAGLVRFQDNWIGKEVTVDLGEFDAFTDFGYDSNGNGNGSLTLTADVFNYPYTGGAYPVLTSLQVQPTDGSAAIEFVNLTSACSTQGMWICAGGYCDANTSCTVQASSSFFNRDDWDQHQTPPFGYDSINSFPRCDAAVGTPAWSQCPSGFNKLPSGHYYAKYVLMSNRNLSVASGRADLRVRLTVRRDEVSRNDPNTSGAISLNVILVGNVLINDSRTLKGGLNLNLLFAEVQRILKNSINVSLGDIKVYEWRDEDGGDYYSQLDYTNMGELFKAGSQGLPVAEEGKAINVFMVRDIENEGSSGTILGLAGAILGPPVNGTESSGLAFSASVAPGRLISGFNPSPNCTLANCDRNSQQGSFLEMGATIAHELGHYLGLNHPSERIGSFSETQRHDQLIDTPKCAPRNVGGLPELNHLSCYEDSQSQLGGAQTCRQVCNQEIRDSNPSAPTATYFSGTTKTSYYCPLTKECQFNHVMWYTIKNRVLGVDGWREDGNQFSDQSSAIIQWSPFVR